MSNTTQDLLKKINYIEADIEIQKQILYSIPSENRPEIEKTIKIIASHKEDIDLLRQEIKEIDPEEFERITVFEKAITDFKEIASKRQFQHISSKNVDEECSLALTDNNKIECLIKACDENGDWTIITMDGEILHYLKSNVSEEPPEQTPFH